MEKLVVRINSKSRLLPTWPGQEESPQFSSPDVGFLRYLRDNKELLQDVQSEFLRIFNLRFWIAQSSTRDKPLYYPQFIDPDSPEYVPTEVPMRSGAEQVLISLAEVCKPATTAMVFYPEDGIAPKHLLRLTDFFLNKLPTKSIIIETGSQLLFYRIRRRIREGNLPLENVEVFFQDQKLDIDSTGRLPNWPDTLFPEFDEELSAMF